MKELVKNIRRIAVATLCIGTVLIVASSLGEGVMNGVENDDGITNIASTPTLEGKSKIVLTVDQRGNLSSTAAVATSADMAAIAASNQLAVAIQQANQEGYATATNLLNEVAASVASSPVIFCSPELTSFVAATAIDEATDKIRIFEWDLDKSTTSTININNVPTQCFKITCGYMFTKEIDSCQPLVSYVEHLEGATNTWDYLPEVQVGTPVTVAHDSYTDPNTETTFTNFYRMNIWIPVSKAAGFYQVVVSGDVPDGEGNTIDTVGVKDGYTGVVTNGTIVLNIRGGYIMQSGTGQLTE